MIDLRFTPRDPNEPQRGATPLELLFDLASVVAIGMAAQGLVDGIEAGRTTAGLVDYLCNFFMIWWAWMNYTWFASAYDDHSPAFRLLTMVTMFGALMLAAGIDAVFTRSPLLLVLAGFCVMRLAMVLLWIGAGRGDPQHRTTARRYAVGITLMQVYWLTTMTGILPSASLFLPLFLVGMVGELGVPLMAERHAPTTWHRGHIMSRHGRFTLIVLGQCFAAIVLTLQSAPAPPSLDAQHLWHGLLLVVIACSIWGLYFTDGPHLDSSATGRAMIWGYGHFIVFSTIAAAGASMHLMIQDPGAAALGNQVLSLALALLAATLWMIRDRYCLQGGARWRLPCLALVLLLLGLATPAPLEAVALVLVSGTLLRRRATPYGTPC
ncbi:low temperature requirement protein A [Halomonas sabkhae]|uniref:low temperature requirement protein A n=1 Tax=Halomonas sabkhae TaxID=626223 RepID=UPI0025B4F153|nr:low temperature requirement protein A [Halomonas sabkhae]MDN3524373.1 low temperature requirement protein A [Halomonas sabkhae]